jgi:hypothetical protein
MTTSYLHVKTLSNSIIQEQGVCEGLLALSSVIFHEHAVSKTRYAQFCFPGFPVDRETPQPEHPQAITFLISQSSIHLDLPSEITSPTLPLISTTVPKSPQRNANRVKRGCNHINVNTLEKDEFRSSVRELRRYSVSSLQCNMHCHVLHMTQVIPPADTTPPNLASASHL